MSTEIEIDQTSGSTSYNRLDMQVSQAVLMAIDLYDNLDFLLVMDFYDDISIFEDSKNPSVVSYYQMKTVQNGESITFNTILSENWLEKLYKHLDNKDVITKELGLITNCPIRSTISNEKYDKSQTNFSSFNTETIEKIKKDISKKMKIDKNSVDLSKFIHLKTTLTIEKHIDMAEYEFGKLLQRDFPDIKFASIQIIYQSLIALLTKKQAYENVKDETDFNIIKKYKGVSKEDINKLIRREILISIPEFDVLDNLIVFAEDEKPYASLQYTKIRADADKKTDVFYKFFEKIALLVKNNKLNDDEKFNDYTKRLIRKLTYNPIYDHNYIKLLIASIYINLWSLENE